MLVRNPWLRIVPNTNISEENIASDWVLRDVYNRCDHQLDHRIINFLYSLHSVHDLKDLECKIKDVYKFDQSIAKEIIKYLIEHSLLISEKDQETILDNDTVFWNDYNWHQARYYTGSTFNFDYLSGTHEDRLKDKELMQEYRENNPPPSPYKKYEGKENIFLKTISEISKIDFENAICQSTQSSINKNLSLDDISALCALPFAETGKISFQNQGEFLLKCVPSGGARHPIEVNVALLNTECDNGLYHYDVKNHKLVKIQNISENELNSIIYEMPIKTGFRPKAVFILSLYFDRSQWRYKEPRSYRVVHNDIGHAIEMLGMTAAGLDYLYYIGHGFKDAELEKLCRMDKNEFASYFVAIG
jgi:SagB-type dehydrogenase family enzyme